jgi:hypothetical protein
MNLTLYCNSHNNIQPRHTQCNQKVIMCGSHALSTEVKDKCLRNDYILDDTFHNISHLNHLIGDLTGLYWVWKNTRNEFVGVNQYCRFYDDHELNCIRLDSSTVYVSKFVYFGDISVWNQFTYWHTDIGVKMLYQAIKENKIAITESMANQLHFQNSLSTCNSFFAHKKLFDRVCSVLFDIVFELYEGCKYIIEHIQHDMHKERPNDRRLLAFLAERILNIIYHNIEYFVGKNVKIQPINFKYYH